MWFDVIKSIINPICALSVLIMSDHISLPHNTCTQRMILYSLFIYFFHNHGYQDQQDTCSYFQGEQFYQTNILLQN